MSQVESYRKFLTEKLEKSCFYALFWIFILFPKFYNGGGMDFGRGITYI